MSKILIKQVKSAIGASERQKKTLQALGLSRIGKEKEHQDNSQIKGMIAKVSHLVELKKVK